MKNDTVYSDAPDDVRDALLNAKQIDDFLPPPELLIPKEETRKVTIALSTKSLEFFKEAAKKTHIPYQQMIRKVLDNYTDHYAK